MCVHFPLRIWHNIIYKFHKLILHDEKESHILYATFINVSYPLRNSYKVQYYKASVKKWNLYISWQLGPLLDYNLYSELKKNINMYDLVFT